jgi:GntR family transcriptional regulator, transcriptional repressor for pyruvate dehydrogenase complex
MDSATWDRVRLSRASDEIVAQLCDALFEGRLQPGEPLGAEAELAAQFGVSRASVREAMRTLEASGIVHIGMGPKGGARIAVGDPRRFAHALAVQLRLVGVTAVEVLDVRMGIEWMSAQLAATNATPAELERLSALVEETAAAENEPARIGELGRALHLAVAEASHNRVLVATLTSIREAMRTHRPAAPPQPHRTIAVHRALVDAIRQRDPQRAGQVMLEDVRRQRDWWESIERAGRG